jgi:DNA (cytosine-5)-methyltransferase 1
LELGLERAGLGPVKWQVEIDDYCNKVLEKHWPKVKRYGDIKSIREGELEPVDIICGGFPCQPVSCAGARKAQSDDRWLWPEFARVLRMVKPRWVVAENVPGLLTANSGGAMGEVLRDLALCGYDVEWDVIRADWVGPPQSRPRVFIVAHPSRKSGLSIFHQNTIDVESNRQRFHVESGGKTNINNKNHRTGTMPVLGDGPWAEILDGERGGDNDGVPSRVDRLKCLGNAVVPQVAEVVGRLIIEAEKQTGDKDGG